MIDPRPLEALEPRTAEVRATITEPRQRELFDRVLRRIDPGAHRALQEKYAQAIAAAPPGFIYKYLDVPVWVKDKVAKVFAMGIAEEPAGRALDLGTGGGHFLAVCNALGFESVGLDLENPFYVDLCVLMGVDRRTFRIEPRRALPDLGRFDLVTAFQIKFDALGVDARGHHRYWSLEDWDFFVFEVTARVLRLPGVLHLELNSRVRPDGEREKFADVLEAFGRAGGEIFEPLSAATFRVEEAISLRRSKARA